MKTTFETCGKKRLYFDEHSAKMGALRTEEVGGKPMRPYCCNVCGYWHLTHRAARQTTHQPMQINA